jgi:copper chaperone CopZ
VAVTNPSSSVPEPTAGQATAAFAVEGMHCEACVALIEETLTEQEGVTSASVDLESARAEVVYDPNRLGTDKLAAAIVEAGYSASPAG